MRTALISAALLVVALFVGCDSQSGVFPLVYGRLDVTPALQSSCPTLTDTEIDYIISLAESDRLAGWTYSDEVAQGLAACDSSTCSICVTAIIRQVYGL